MKKLSSIVIATTIPFGAIAQDSFPEQNSHFNMEIFNISATILVLVLVMVFVLSILKRMLEYRIKNKIVEKGVPEELASSILQPSSKEDGTTNFKWFCVLTGMGVGLSIVVNASPLGLHSLAIMSFSFAASFLAYHFFLKHSKK